MKTIKIIISLLLMLLVSSVWAQNKKHKHVQQTKFKKHYIIMQLTSNDKAVHKGLIKQLNNLKNGWGDTVEIQVVCHGPGIDFLHTERTQFADDIYELKKRGIVFTVCENSLKEREVPKDKILSDMHFVLMGIGEIVLKQEQGWSYIKAGF
jgi:intracellular sulfur oxidation DsrE/DsrF family protein